MFPTGRWRKGDVIREVFKLSVPQRWAVPKADKMQIGLRMTAAKGTKTLEPKGATRSGDKQTALLGELPLLPGRASLRPKVPKPKKP